MSVRFVFASIGLLWASSAFAAPAITIAGACPGTVDVGLTGATANGSTALVTGKHGGSTVLAAGPCAGTTVGVGKAVLRAVGNADATGARTLHPNLAAGACASDALWLDQTTCQTSPVVSLTPTCTQPVTSWIDAGPPAGPPFMADPVLFGLWTEATNAAGLRQNFTVQDPGGNFDIPATLVVDFFDGAGNLMCSNFFDIQLATPNPGYTAVSLDNTGAATMNPVTPTDPVSVTLTGGATNCLPIDPAGPLGVGLGGSSDLRVFSQGALIDFAYNAKISNDLKNTIIPFLAGGLAEWNTDWQPFVIGESFFGLELGWSDTFGQTCGTVDADPVTFDLVHLPKPKGVLSEHEISTDFWLFAL